MCLDVVNPPSGAVHANWIGFDSFQHSSIEALVNNGRKMKYALIRPGDSCAVNWKTAFSVR